MSDYVPLAKSHLWSSMEEKMTRFPDEPAMYPSLLHALSFLTLQHYEWSEGLPFSIDRNKSRYDQKPVDAPFQPTAPDADPAQNMLLDFIPVLPDEKTLMLLSNDVDTHAEYARLYPDNISSAGRSSLGASLPANPDIHYLTAILMMSKHLWQNSHRISEDTWPPKTEQLQAFRYTLNTGLELIETRSLTENFVKSATEFTAAIPSLIEMTPAYIARQNADYASSLAHKTYLESIGPSAAVTTGLKP